ASGREGAPAVGGREQARTNQRGESRAAVPRGDVSPGAPPGTFPRPADLGAVLVVELAAIAGRVLAVARLDGDQDDCLVDAEQPDAAGIAVGGGFKDIGWHGQSPSGWGKSVLGARPSKRSSPSSLVQSGTAR